MPRGSDAPKIKPNRLWMAAMLWLTGTVCEKSSLPCKAGKWARSGRRQKKQKRWRSTMAAIKNDAGAVSSRHCTVWIKMRVEDEKRQFCSMEGIMYPLGLTSVSLGHKGDIGQLSSIDQQIHCQKASKISVVHMNKPS